jgi:hypothetical protein|eukprot:COSAG06_NODE_1349_length_9776_cov_110.373049_13_plen_473_part_00
MRPAAQSQQSLEVQRQLEASSTSLNPAAHAAVECPAAAAVTASSKSGPLRKLSGKQHDQWRAVNVHLSPATGLSWSSGSVVRDRASGSQSVLAPPQMLSVAYYSDIGVEHAFEVASSAKGGKVYKFAAESESESEAWIVMIDAVIASCASTAPAAAEVTVDIDLDAASMCAVCLEDKPNDMRPFPNPDCIHRYCMECLELLHASQLFPSCPECRRPALADDGTEVSSAVVVRDMTEVERRGGSWRRVLKRAVVRNGPTPSAMPLGELRPGDLVEVLEKRNVDGHRRVRIGRDMWASRVTHRGSVLIDGPGPRTTVTEGRLLMVCVLLGALASMGPLRLWGLGVYGLVPSTIFALMLMIGYRESGRAFGRWWNTSTNAERRRHCLFHSLCFVAVNVAFVWQRDFVWNAVGLHRSHHSALRNDDFAMGFVVGTFFYVAAVHVLVFIRLLVEVVRLVLPASFLDYLANVWDSMKT